MNNSIQTNITFGKTFLYFVLIPLILLIHLFFFFPAQAQQTFTANFNGNYTNKDIWLPAYPGNVIGKHDTIVINKNVRLNSDIVIHGTLIVKSKSALRGNNSILLTEESVLQNEGVIVVSNVQNQGLVRNKHILETSGDLSNTGTLVNFESMIVGNIFDNKGMLSGNGGHLLVNEKLVNYNDGQIGGNIDICTGDFRNVMGGAIDSTYISFCGQRIYNGAFLTANLNRESVILNLLNTEGTRFEEYEIQRSTDGNNFSTIAIIEGDEINDFALAFRYTDREMADNPSVFYRMKLRRGGSETAVPVLEVNNIFAINATRRTN